jgi:hypothetical protein
MTLDAAAAELASLILRVGAGVDSNGTIASRIGRQWRQRNLFLKTLCQNPSSKTVFCTEGRHLFLFPKNALIKTRVRFEPIRRILPAEGEAYVYGQLTCPTANEQ